MIKRIFAVFVARNLEFVRDRSSLGWNLVVPVILVLGIGAIFSEENASQFTVGILGDAAAIDDSPHPFLSTRYIEFVPVADHGDAVEKVSRHQLDLVVALSPSVRYWVNPESPSGYVVERLLLQSDPSASKQTVPGRPIRYVDWLLPGVLGMNMMFSCLFGVGYVVVRYRKSGFLKRLGATPLSALEFIIAQVLSRLVIILGATAAVFVGVTLLLEVPVHGSYGALFAVALLGSIALIALALVVAARVASEEFAGGLLNMLAWPMMLLSGVFYSLEGSSAWIQNLALALPLTHLLSAARAIMIDGAALAQVWPQLLVLSSMAVLFTLLGAVLIRWRFV